MGICYSKDETEKQLSSKQSIQSNRTVDKLRLNKGNYIQNLEFIEDLLLNQQETQQKIMSQEDEMRETIKRNQQFLEKNPYIFRDEQSITQICRKIVEDLSQKIQSEQFQLSNDQDGYQLIKILLLQFQVSITELQKIKEDYHYYIIQLKKLLELNKFQPEIQNIEERIEQEQKLYTNMNRENVNNQKEQLRVDIPKLEEKLKNAGQQIEEWKNSQMNNQINQLLIDYQKLVDKVNLLIKSIKEIEIQVKQYLQSLQIKLIPNNERSQFTQQYINNIYDLSWRKRHVEERYKRFVRDIENERELKNNYSISLQDMKTIKTICKSYRPVRGDGNCFYTAFGYQYLKILLKNYSIIEFYQFLKKIIDIKLRMEISIKNQNLELNLEQEQLLLEEFILKLIQLREIENIDERIETFTNQFGDYDGEYCCLYGLSTIFLRNLSKYALGFHHLKETVYDVENLLIWETECDNNEVIIDCLGQYLNTKVKLVFFGKDSCQIKDYANTGREQIILLIRPGHYNIGIDCVESPEEIKEKELLKIVQKCIEGLENKENKENIEKEEENNY